MQDILKTPPGGASQDMAFTAALVEITDGLLLGNRVYPTPNGLAFNEGAAYTPAHHPSDQRSMLMLQILHGLGRLVTATRIAEVRAAIADTFGTQLGENEEIVRTARYHIVSSPRNATYQAMLLAILARQDISVRDVERYGAQNIVEAAMEHLRQLLGYDAMTFWQALDLLTAA